MEAWVASANRDIRSIGPRRLGAAEGAPEMVRRSGGGIRSGRRGAFPGVLADARASVSPAPENAPPPEPLEEIPVKDAAQRIAEKSDRRLPPQTLPALEMTPWGEIPRIVGEPSPPPAATRGKGGTAPGSEARDAPNKRRLEKSRSEAAQKEPEGESGVGEPVVISDVAPPKRRPFPPRLQSNVGAVLAQLLARTDVEARDILTSTRGALYGGVLLGEFPDIGDDLLPELTASLDRELRLIATQAGITKDALDRKIADRQRELLEREQRTRDATTDAAADERKQIKDEGQQRADEIAGAKNAIDQATERQVDAVGGRADPKVVYAKRDRLAQQTNRQIAAQVVAYEEARKKQVAQLDIAAGAQIRAYRATTQREKDRILAEAGADPAAVSTAQASAGVAHRWGDDRVRTVSNAAANAKESAATHAATFTREVRKVGDDINVELRVWADRELGVERSWWQQLFDRISAWAARAKEESAAWEAARAGENRDAIVADMVLLNGVVERAGDHLDVNREGALAGLSAEQQAVIRSYYGSGPDARNPVTAVAAGLRARIATQRRPQIIATIEAKLGVAPYDDWKVLNRLGQKQRADFDANALCNRLDQAMNGGWTGIGTDEQEVFASLAALTKLQSIAVRRCWVQRGFGWSLDAELEDELSGAEYTRAKALLDNDQASADAATLHEAMHGGITGIGTDEDAINHVLRGKSAEERAAIRARYYELYHVSLDEDIASETSGHDYTIANAYIQGDVDKADATRLKRGLEGGLFGIPDQDEIDAVYKDIENDVKADAKASGMTSEEVHEEVIRRNRQVETTYNIEYGKDWKPGDESALRQTFASKLSGPQLALANALADRDLIAADAARLALEDQALISTDDDAVNGLLRHQYERALEEVRLDEEPRMHAEMERRAAADADAGRPWDPYRRRAEERLIERKLEVLAREKAKGYMAQLETTFDTKWGRWGPGSLHAMIEVNMSGAERDMARDLAKQGGYLTPAQEIHYAVTGAGTKEEAIERALAGRSPEEIARIAKEYEEQYGESMSARILSETSGSTQFDLKEALQGEPRNEHEEIEQIRRRAKYELDTSSDRHAGPHKARLLEDLADAEARYKLLDDPSLSPQERVRRLELFQESTRNVRVSAKATRTQMEAVTDTLATVAAVVAAVLVIVVATILTAGTATGPLAALAASLTSGAVAAASAAAAVVATVATKMALRGDAYGWEDIGIDVAVGLVDVAVSFATAGIGGALLKGARAGRPAAGALMRMGKSSSRLTRMFAHGLAEGAEGMLSSFPTALAGNMLNDQNWERGNALTNILAGTALETTIGTVVSGGVGSLSGISRARPKVRPTNDLLARRGTPKDRMKAWRDFKRANPDADPRAFLRDFDAGVAKRAADEQVAKQAQREMRRELLKGIPPGERGRFAKVRIDVLSDAEFTRLTKSQTGQAVVLIEKGRPRVILREGVDPKKLREEGLHLLQSVDPGTRKLVRRLDERRLANWDKLSLSEQLDLYRTKIDLEIDAHQRLLRDLDDEMASAGADRAARREVTEQADEARETLRNLRRRANEVNSIPPEKRVLMSQGIEPKPQYLEQKPRLFNKARAQSRVEIHNSPVSKKKGHKTYQLGDTFRENGRTYRRVVVHAPDGTIRVRTEIQLKSPPKRKGKWVLRGSEATRSGEAAEEASRALSRAEMPSLGRGAKGPRHVPVNVQTASGQGFDEVVFKIDSVGSARVTIIEVKNYPGRHVPLKDFSAITTNMKQNLRDLEDRVAQDFDKMGLTQTQRDAVLDAIRARRLDIEIRLAPGTKLGKHETGTVLAEVQRRAVDALKRPGVVPDIRVPNAREISTTFAEDGTAAIAAKRGADHVSGVTKRRKQLAAIGKNGDYTAESMRRADAALKAERQAGSGLEPPVRRARAAVTFLDAKNRPFVVVSPFSPSDRPLDVKRTLDHILRELRRSPPLPKGEAAASMRVVIDISDLTRADLRNLRKALRRTDEGRRPGRVIYVTARN
jgi:hypothetical protein